MLTWDFVIKAFNRDMPFDQFVRWQVAGDEIALDDPLALSATGFLGAGVFPTQLTEKEFESAMMKWMTWRIPRAWLFLG